MYLFIEFYLSYLYRLNKTHDYLKYVKRYIFEMKKDIFMQLHENWIHISNFEFCLYFPQDADTKQEVY